MPPATDVSGVFALLAYRGRAVLFKAGGAVAVAPDADFGDIVDQPDGTAPQDHIR
ncbi:hypothetical protein [Ensifer adhaerens]|uniref:hypothetical protein n=1 Tax=Ensifer adhaerens TaxID=106592 RepID=UPI001319DF81|nr:hypothetical protein [Ensifer adhaerens]